jgi:hypothetical protein
MLASSSDIDSGIATKNRAGHHDDAADFFVALRSNSIDPDGTLMVPLTTTSWVCELHLDITGIEVDDESLMLGECGRNDDDGEG